MPNTLQEKLNNIKTQKDTYLLPENVKKDVTVLGVTGSYEGNPVTVKHFDSLNMMYDDPDKKLNDIAIVGSYAENGYEKDTAIKSLTFPASLTFSSAFEDGNVEQFLSQDDATTDVLEIEFYSTGINIYLKSNRFLKSASGDSVGFYVMYTSYDGLHYYYNGMFDVRNTGSSDTRYTLYSSNDSYMFDNEVVWYNWDEEAEPPEYLSEFFSQCRYNLTFDGVYKVQSSLGQKGIRTDSMIVSNGKLTGLVKNFSRIDVSKMVSQISERLGDSPAYPDIFLFRDEQDTEVYAYMIYFNDYEEGSVTPYYMGEGMFWSKDEVHITGLSMSACDEGTVIMKYTFLNDGTFVRKEVQPMIQEDAFYYAELPQNIYFIAPIIAGKDIKERPCDLVRYLKLVPMFFGTEFEDWYPYFNTMVEIDTSALDYKPYETVLSSSDPKSVDSDLVVMSKQGVIKGTKSSKVGTQISTFGARAMFAMDQVESGNITWEAENYGPEVFNTTVPMIASDTDFGTRYQFFGICAEVEFYGVTFYRRYLLVYSSYGHTSAGIKLLFENGKVFIDLPKDPSSSYSYTPFKCYTYPDTQSHSRGAGVADLPEEISWEDFPKVEVGEGTGYYRMEIPRYVTSWEDVCDVRVYQNFTEDYYNRVSGVDSDVPITLETSMVHREKALSSCGSLYDCFGSRYSGMLSATYDREYVPKTTDISLTSGIYSNCKIKGVTYEIDPNIRTGNIKSGVTILGITGTFTDSGTITDGNKVIAGEVVYSKGSQISGQLPDNYLESCARGPVVTIPASMSNSELGSLQKTKGSFYLNSNITLGDRYYAVWCITAPLKTDPTVMKYSSIIAISDDPIIIKRSDTATAHDNQISYSMHASMGSDLYESSFMFADHQYIGDCSKYTDLKITSGDMTVRSYICETEDYDFSTETYPLFASRIVGDIRLCTNCDLLDANTNEVLIKGNTRANRIPVGESYINIRGEEVPGTLVIN